MANNTNKQRLLTAAEIYSDDNFPYFKNDIERIKYMGTKLYKDPDGKEIEYLTVEEVKSLSIAKGTLTAEERNIVEQHVVFTDKMLAG